MASIAESQLDWGKSEIFAIDTNQRKTTTHLSIGGDEQNPLGGTFLLLILYALTLTLFVNTVPTFILSQDYVEMSQ